MSKQQKSVAKLLHFWSQPISGIKKVATKCNIFAALFLWYRFKILIFLRQKSGENGRILINYQSIL